MSTGPAGFRNTPVTKVLVTVIGGCSAISTLFEGNRLTIQNPLWRLISSQWVFTDIGSTVVGTWLIYKLRIIESRYGSSKFAALVFISFALSTLFHQAADFFFDGTRVTISGPYALIFAILYQYHSIVPNTYRIPVLMNVTMTDKSYVYAAAAQLLMSHLPSSLAPCHFGLFIGAVYNFGNIRRWRFPSPIRTFFSRFILPVLGTSSPMPPTSTLTSTSSNSRLATPAIPSSTGSSSISSTNPSATRQRNATSANDVEIPASSENIDALVSMFPDCSRDAIASALVSSRHDLNRAAETLLTTAPSQSSTPSTNI
ncbi:hypothetical protein BCR42DRAFT_404152 [Absidia repens]|uniref:CUE domain-containing protein n=1 Tax=Absidia repens TaxID=90262 RepID=A0A1X2IVY6_9FUNG|nr:hypothetical protein BCR42DRAFT_404152 [Absidia repens]